MIRKLQNCLLFLFILVLLISAGCTTSEDKKKYKEIENGMAAYLQNTYGKEFVVKGVKLDGNEGFGYDLIKAQAYPKDNEEVVFNIGTYKSKPNHYNEDYLSKLWSYQGSKEIGEKLKDVYEEDFPYRYDMYCYRSVTLANMDTIKKLNHSQVMDQYREYVDCYLEYHIFLEKNVNKTIEAERALELFVKNIKDRYKTYSVGFYYHPMSYKDQFVSDYGKESYFSDEAYKAGKVLNILILRDDKKMQNVSDLINLFEY